MSSVKKKPMGESSVILGGINRFQNKQNLNCDEMKQMIQLLKAYETLCIQREDFSGAESVKNKIQQLMSEQLQYKRKTIAVREKQQKEVVCKQGEDEIKKFQEHWDVQVQTLIEELKKAEEEMSVFQKKEMQQLVDKMKGEDVPKVKFSSQVLEKRSYLANLIKSRQYKQAELVKNTLKDIQAQQQIKWAEKFQEKKRLRIQKLQKKQLGQLHAMRLKLQAIFNEKIKERDRKFQILIKKNRKRIIDSSKPSRERIRSRNGILTESKFHSNASYM